MNGPDVPAASPYRVAGWLCCVAVAGCIDRASGRSAGDAAVAAPVQLDTAPTLLNRTPPFRYPMALWERRVQGSLTLRLFIDSTGRAVRDSTRIATSSGVAEFDSAAMAGAGELRFAPARFRGRSVGVPLLLPVFFRHPDVPPLPGDTAIKRMPHDTLTR